MKHNYVVATIRPWNIKIFNDVIKHYHGQWTLITEPVNLNIDKVKSLNPRYIFFPHWSKIVPKNIIDYVDCICFHETDLPYGRGGSPIQNLISRGHKDTMITALKMTDELDAGPIYLKQKLSLDGIAEKIYGRSAKIVADMIKQIITSEPDPQEQEGVPVYFKRREKKQSEVQLENISINSLYDHIRMLDAPEYPKAFIQIGEYRLELSNPVKDLKTIQAKVKIIKNSLH